MSGRTLVTIVVRGAEAALEVASVLDDIAGAVSAFEICAGDLSPDGPGAEWKVEAYPRQAVLGAALEVRLSLAAAAAGGTLVEITEQPLRERDWLTENHRAFPPLRIAPFFTHASHHPANP